MKINKFITLLMFFMSFSVLSSDNSKKSIECLSINTNNVNQQLYISFKTCCDDLVKKGYNFAESNSVNKSLHDFVNAFLAKNGKQLSLKEENFNSIIDYCGALLISGGTKVAVISNIVSKYAELLYQILASDLTKNSKLVADLLNVNIYDEGTKLDVSSILSTLKSENLIKQFLATYLKMVLADDPKGFYWEFKLLNKFTQNKDYELLGFNVLKNIREFDLVVKNKVKNLTFYIEAKNINWQNNAQKTYSQFAMQNQTAKNHRVEFVIVSAQVIPSDWAEGLRENKIKFVDPNNSMVNVDGPDFEFLFKDLFESSKPNIDIENLCVRVDLNSPTANKKATLFTKKPASPLFRNNSSLNSTVFENVCVSSKFRASNDNLDLKLNNSPAACASPKKPKKIMVYGKKKPQPLSPKIIDFTDKTGLVQCERAVGLMSMVLYEIMTQVIE